MLKKTVLLLFLAKFSLNSQQEVPSLYALSIAAAVKHSKNINRRSFYENLPENIGEDILSVALFDHHYRLNGTSNKPRKKALVKKVAFVQAQLSILQPSAQRFLLNELLQLKEVYGSESIHFIIQKYLRLHSFNVDIHYPAKYASLDTIQIFFMLGVNCNINKIINVNEHKAWAPYLPKTPLDCAIENKNLEVANFLGLRGAKRAKESPHITAPRGKELERYYSRCLF